MRTALFAFALLLAGTVAPAATFTFDSLGVGDTTPFSLSSSGLTASFSSPEASSFFVAPSFLILSSGNVLVDSDPTLHALHILFSQPVVSISLTFGLNTLESGSLTLEAFSDSIGGTSAGTTVLAGVIQPGGMFPEGLISLSNPAGLSAVRLTSSVSDFAIDNVVAVETPEPGTVLLITVPLVVLALSKVKRR